MVTFCLFGGGTLGGRDPKVTGSASMGSAIEALALAMKFLPVSWSLCDASAGSSVPSSLVPGSCAAKLTMSDASWV